MDLRPYVDTIQQQLLLAGEAGGDEARAVAERLLAPLDATIRLALQDALAAAAEEITCELAPGSVELRLRGTDPEFVVTPPPIDEPADDGPTGAAGNLGGGARDADDGAIARINVRMPDQLKLRVDQAAAAESLSVNSWLVRAATAALERTEFRTRREPRGAHGRQRYTGWAR